MAISDLGEPFLALKRKDFRRAGVEVVEVKMVV